MSFFNPFLKEKEIDQSNFSQADFLSAVRAGGIKMERSTKLLIDQFKGYQLMFRGKYGLETHEAVDAYTDAIMVLISYIRLGKFDERYSISTYLYRLTKNKCIDCLRQKGRAKRMQKVEIPEVPMKGQSGNLLQEILLSDAYHHVLIVMERLKGKCKEIILKWGYWGYSMKEIAQSLNFKSPEVVRTQKGRCLNSLRKALKSDSKTKNLTLD